MAKGARASGLQFRAMRRVGLMLAAVLATLVAASVVALPNQGAPAEAAGNDVIAIVIEGTGNGHGRGMSQWGAYGWAVDHGWSWDQILDWYYGGTAMGDADVNSRMTVRLLGLDNSPSVGVVSYSGGVIWNGQASPYVSMRAEWNGASFNLYGSGAATCAAETLLGQVGGVSFTTATGEVSNSSAPAAIGVCEPNGSVTHYRGSIDVTNPAGVRVVNSLRTEDYLRGVVPREVAASWADAGGGAGANAVRAQAVAARSYSLAAEPLPVRQDLRHHRVPGLRRRGDTDDGRRPAPTARGQPQQSGRRRDGGQDPCRGRWRSSRPSSRHRTGPARPADRSPSATTPAATARR